MKNVSRNKFFKCFRPVVNMDHLMLDSKAVLVDRSQKHQALKYVGVKEEKEDIMKPSTSTNKSSVSDAEESHHRAGKKRFSQVIKAVFFEILLVCSSFFSSFYYQMIKLLYLNNILLTG